MAGEPTNLNHLLHAISLLLLRGREFKTLTCCPSGFLLPFEEENISANSRLCLEYSFHKARVKPLAKTLAPSSADSLKDELNFSGKTYTPRCRHSLFVLSILLTIPFFSFSFDLLSSSTSKHRRLRTGSIYTNSEELQLP